VKTILGASFLALAATGYGAAFEEPMPKPPAPGAAATVPVVNGLALVGDDEALEVRIAATAPLPFTYFELEKPRRLVVDFPGIQNTFGFKDRSVGRAGVERIRTSFFTDKTRQATRIVFDLTNDVPYRVDKDVEGFVRIEFGTRKPAPPSLTASAGDVAGAVAVPDSPAAVPAALAIPEPAGSPAGGYGVDLRPASATISVPISVPSGVAGLKLAIPPALVGGLGPTEVLAAVQTRSPFDDIVQVASLREFQLPTSSTQPAVFAALAVPETAIPRAPAASTAPVPAIAEGLEIAAVAFASTIADAAAAPVPPKAQQPLNSPYTGEIISLDLKDVDLKDFFRLISEISGLNVVLDPNIGGSLTTVLKDVPWDQALDVVLRNYQLGSQLQGNVLRIASVATLEREDAARKATAAAQEATAELDMHTYRLNYTKSDLVKATLQKFLTPRGEIVEDVRKNTVFVKDVPAQFARIDTMVKYLDTPAQQVEIEARLLVANKSFSRDIGNQLGFLFGAKGGNVLTGGTGVPGPLTVVNGTPRTVGTGVGLPLAANFPAAATSGLAFLMQPGGDILLDEIITLAEARGTAKTISRPKITTQNNKPATIQQGTQIPVQTNVNNTVSVQFISFALKLTVTPLITEANTILLDVSVENSQPDFAKAVNGIPSVSTQQAATQVLMPDGGTAAIGGILIDTDSLNVNQVPGLGSIPVVGNLFKGTKTLKTTGELLFFVTARVRPPDTVEPGQ
jgi:type IV pilus assembly protein PilQ